jgi:DNA repair protein RadA
MKSSGEYTSVKFTISQSHLEMIIQDLGKSIEEYKAKLIIVDSIIALHRAEFTGRATLAERQQRLNIMLHKLSRLAEVHNIAVVVTNQVQSQPDDFSAGRDGLRATGGSCFYLQNSLKKSRINANSDND